MNEDIRERTKQIIEQMNIPTGWDLAQVIERTRNQTADDIVAELRDPRYESGAFRQAADFIAARFGSKSGSTEEN